MPGTRFGNAPAGTAAPLPAKGVLSDAASETVYSTSHYRHNGRIKILRRKNKNSSAEDEKLPPKPAKPVFWLAQLRGAQAAPVMAADDRTSFEDGIFYMDGAGRAEEISVATLALWWQQELIDPVVLCVAAPPDNQFCPLDQHHAVPII